MGMSNLAYESEERGVAVEADTDPAAMKELRPVPRISIQAFCETESVAAPIERAGEDRRMTKAHLKVHMGGVATAIEFYQSAPTPNLIIIESRQEPKQLLESLAQLADVWQSSATTMMSGSIAS
jgi:pilus assembly protein CpaE